MSIPISVMMLSGEAIELDAEVSDRICDVKSKICSKAGFPCEQQQLMFEGQQLDDWLTVSDCGIQTESTLMLLLGLSKRLLIGVKLHSLSGQTMELDVSDLDTICDVKTQLSNDYGIPYEDQRLIFAGHQLEDDFTLNEYGIQNGSTIHLVLCICKRMQITVKKVSGQTLMLDVDTSTTVSSLKVKICEREGVLCDQQRLLFLGKHLEDSCTLSDYGIQSKSVVHLFCHRGTEVPLLGQSEMPIPDHGISHSSSQLAIGGSCNVPGTCGLHNLGNTCFMNSTLQALSNTFSLRQYYGSGKFEEEISTSPMGMGGRLARSFADLLKMVWSGMYPALPPTEIRNLISERRPEFRGYGQHDAQEFLMFMLDGLHEDTNRAPYPRPFIEDPSSVGKAEGDIATEAWSGNLLRNNSCIVEIFQFQVRSEISFPDVQACSLKFDPMMNLSLPIPEPKLENAHALDSEISLEQCLELFSRSEELSQEDWVHCEKTQEVQRSIKKLDIWTAPQCLVIHLKRFRSDRCTGRSQKVDTFVRAPIELELSPWTRGPAADHDGRYRLHAVVNHSGSLGFGHYTAYCRIGPDGRWYLFNDSAVTCASEEEVVSRAAYILFYERI